MKQNSLLEKVEVIGTGRTVVNLNYALRTGIKFYLDCCEFELGVTGMKFYL